LPPRKSGGEGKVMEMSMTDKIACVIDSFDEEGREPANYVVEHSDDGFEARVWDLNLEKELSLGTCESLGDATCLIWMYSDQVRWLSEWFPNPAQYLRPN
jgi:hypothetical protein